jgi:nucleoside-diphosphate-sugar epimerase
VSRRVAVTGATGFIGRHLTVHLAANGDDVRAIVRPSSMARMPPFLRSDITIVDSPLEERRLVDAFRNVEVVVHLAGVVAALNDSDYATTNVEGTRAVARAAHAAGARLVHVSSLAAAGPAPASAPRREDDPVSPITAYGRSKLDAERVVAGVDGLRWTILRPAAVYGPGDRAMLPLFRFASRGVLPLVGRTTAAYTLVNVGDVVRTIATAVAKETNSETMFVGHPDAVTAREILEGIRTAIGRRALIVRIPSALTRLSAIAGDLAGALRGRPTLLNGSRYRELSANGFVCNVDRLRDRLGVVAQTGLREGLAETAAWYRREGWL